MTIATFPERRFAEEELILTDCPACTGNRDIRRNIILLYDTLKRKLSESNILQPSEGIGHQVIIVWVK